MGRHKITDSSGCADLSHVPSQITAGQSAWVMPDVPFVAEMLQVDPNARAKHAWVSLDGRLRRRLGEKMASLCLL